MEKKFLFHSLYQLNSLVKHMATIMICILPAGPSNVLQKQFCQFLSRLDGKINIINFTINFALEAYSGSMGG